ncbi:hypothetical protein GCG54_00005942 [Colletotrichum gloeosporioides]|uniref:Uncharacterized protein n=1 Tax=Colletotrichum gloeosporioides TaxID=474922 RepID=A0A8H4FLD3_COLGL|nr:uncharacterized protein GCG54_00005942 [Colletotrichum gloeosporioides]KAF3806181.1 hypothetical protein GCG54_00005942 [Colletotrichum gloeosporioides]
MAAMSRLLGAVTVMAFTVISSTAIPFTGKPFDPNCGVICSNLERPYDGAVCYETKREDGTCQPVWVNTAMLSTRGDGLKDVNHPVPSGHHHNPAPFAGNLPIINDREDAGTSENSLAKRLQFDLAPKPQRVCEYANDTVVGNSDIWATLAQGFNECGTNDKMEVQGMLDCDDWNLFFWIGSKDKFECCKGERPPQRVRKRTNSNLGYEALDSVLGTCTLEAEKGTWLLAFVKHHRHTEELQK